MAPRFAVLLLAATFFVCSASVDQDQYELQITEDEDLNSDETILMQTTAQFDSARQAPGAIARLLLRAVLGILLLVPAILAYVGVPESLQFAGQAWSSSLFGDVGRADGKGTQYPEVPHDTSGRFLASVSTNSTSSPDDQGMKDSLVSEDMLDQMLEEDCCDGAVPGLQTGVKLLKRSTSRAKQSGDNADAAVSDEVVDALLADAASEGAPPALALQTGVKLLRNSKSDGLVADAILAEPSEEEMMRVPMPRGFSLVRKSKTDHEQVQVNGNDLVSDQVLDAMLSEPSFEEEMQALPGRNTQRKINLKKSKLVDEPKVTPEVEPISDEVLDAILSDQSLEEAKPTLQTGLTLVKGGSKKSPLTSPIRSI